MKSIYLLLLFLVPFVIQADPLFSASNHRENVILISSDATSSVFEFNVNSLFEESFEQSNFGLTSKFNLGSNNSIMGIIGSPDLPVIRRMVLVPNHGKITLDVITSETSVLGNYRVGPYQEPQTYSGTPPEYRIDNTVYQNSSFFPATSVEIEKVEVLRDIRVAWVTFSPIQVNPVTGEVMLTTNVSINISATDELGENELNRIPVGYTESFLPIYNQVIGFEEDMDLVNGSYVFIGSTESISLAEELINWKKQKGYEVHIGDLTEIGTTVSEIDAWLENAFNTWTNPPEYILLIGDNYVVPSPQFSGSEIHAADNQYATLGSGNLPSMHIGRISGNDSDDLAYISWKIKNAELNPYQPAGDSWFNSAFSMACTSPMNAAYESLMLHQLFMANALQSAFYCDALGGDDPTLSAVTTEINDGVSVINYIGHGTITGLVTSGFNISAIAGLTNGRKMPWMFTVGCQNGEFDGNYCFTEAFLSEGTISDPKGAVNVMGSSTFTPIGPGDTLQIHTFRGYFTEEIYHLGAAHSFGKAACYSSFGSSGIDMVNMAHVFGCPETDIFTDTSPVQYLTNTHSSSVTAGAFQVTVSDNSDLSVEGALVGVYYADTEELLDSDYTDASGVANLTIPSLPGSNTVTITSTVHNRVPAVTYANSTAIEESETAGLPSFYLDDIYPNPVVVSAAINFNTTSTGIVNLEVFDVSGRKVTTIQSGNIEAGAHSLMWNTETVSNGLYFVNLSSSEGTLTQPLVVLR